MCRFLPDGRLDLSNATMADSQLMAALSERWASFGPAALGARDSVALSWPVVIDGRERSMVSRAVAERSDSGEVEAVVVVTNDDPAQRLDGLTGLLTEDALRVVLDARAGVQPVAGMAVALALFEVDGFEHLVSSLGRTTGDLAVSAVADSIVHSLRDRDVAYRARGNGIAVFFVDGMTADAASAVATRIQRSASAAAESVIGRPVTLSVGLAQPDTELAWPDLLLWARRAAAVARSSGGDRIELYREGLHLAATQDRRRESTLREAIDAGQLIVSFQPVVELGTGTIVGAEALVGWDHPTEGLLGPAAFVPVAERTDLILDVTRFVLDEGLARLADHQRAHPGDPFTLSINITAADLADPAFTGTVTGALVASGVDRSAVCLELTETAVVADTDAAIATLAALRDLGVSIALDDFGTGFASLSLLRRLPVDRLKIDQTFVAGLPAAADVAVIRLVMGLAGELGLAVTAEGIETPAQAAILCELGCEVGQGFLYARPTRVDRLADLVAGGS